MKKLETGNGTNLLMSKTSPVYGNNALIRAFVSLKKGSAISADPSLTIILPYAKVKCQQGTRFRDPANWKRLFD